MKQIETATVKIPSKKLFILNVYRPFGDKHKCIKELGDYIDKLQADELLYQFIVTGDFNINILEMDDISTSLMDIFTFRGFLQQVAIPTHITLSMETLIDHVYTKLREKSTTDVIMSGISDHEMT